MEGDLSSVKESVIQTSLLLGQIYSYLEVGILDDLPQGRSDLRIQNFKIGESMPSNGLRRL